MFLLWLSDQRHRWSQQTGFWHYFCCFLYRSAASSRTVTSTASSGSLSRIPIQRNSSLRRKKTVMNRYQPLPPSSSNPNLVQGTYHFDENAPLAAIKSSKVPSLFNDQNYDQDSIPPGYSPMASTVTNKTTKKSSKPDLGPTPKTSKAGGRGGGLKGIRSRSNKYKAPLPPRSSKMNGTQSKSVGSELNHLSDPDLDPGADGTDAFKKSSLVPLTPPEKNRISARSHRHDRTLLQDDPLQVAEENVVPEPVDVGMEAPPPTADLSVPPPPDRSVLSTAQSTISNSNYQHLQLKTVITLKSPFEGSNLGPAPVSPPEFLAKSMEQMESGDWEVNVKGMTGVLRLAMHHPDYLIPSCKELIEQIMKHVKNLRSQVGISDW